MVSSFSLRCGHSILLLESKAKAKSVKKTIKLGAKMTISDLRNKMRAASELAKKTDIIRITMPVTEETADAGRNVIMTVILFLCARLIAIVR